MDGQVVAVGAGRRHGLTKVAQDSVRLIAGIGVEGDAHAGERIRHRSRTRFNPGLSNLRQVHLLHDELLDELTAQGFAVQPVMLGENITTRDIDLLGLPLGARLLIGAEAIVEVTGLRNPCIQLERLMPRLMNACLGRTLAGELIRKAGIMAVVITGGTVQAGDAVAITLPAQPFVGLKPV